MEECVRWNTGEETILLPKRNDARKLYLEVTSACNFSCITCIRHSWREKDEYMAFVLFEKLLADAQEFPDIKTIHFGGFGESLLHPDILAMLALCKKNGYKTEMITNGSLLTSSMLERLIDLELEWLFVSLDGPDEKSFQQIRPGAAGFTEVTDAVRLLQTMKKAKKKMRPLLGVEFVMMKDNYQQIPAIRRLANELRANKLLLTNLLPYHESMKEQILYGEVTPDLKKFGSDASMLSILTMGKFEITSWRDCKFVQDKAMVISATGEVSPCYAFLHNYTCYIIGREKKVKAQSFGNLNEKSLSEIWTEASYRVFRYTVRNNLYPSCTDCPQVDGCVMSQDNEVDCWGTTPACGDCLWARSIVLCP